MSVYNLSPIYAPQFLDSGVLVFATPGNPTVVPAGYQYQISVMRVSNTHSAPVTLEMWRVPAGQPTDTEHIVVPSIQIPVATQTFPWLDVTTFWGAILSAGDSIIAQAGSASHLVLHADGAVVVL